LFFAYILSALLTCEGKGGWAREHTTGEIKCGFNGGIYAPGNVGVSLEDGAAGCVLVGGGIVEVEVDLAIFAGLCYGDSGANGGVEIRKVDVESWE
jgi:hypothetical protein